MWFRVLLFCMKEVSKQKVKQRTKSTSAVLHFSVMSTFSLRSSGDCIKVKELIGGRGAVYNLTTAITELATADSSYCYYC